VQCRVWRGDAGAHNQPQRLSVPPVRHPSGFDLSIPKLREGSYYLGWLLEPRRRAERALVAVVAECHVRGVSRRRVEGLVQTLAGARIRKTMQRRDRGRTRV
jgi:transposase-like protein